MSGLNASQVRGLNTVAHFRSQFTFARQQFSTHTNRLSPMRSGALLYRMGHRYGLGSLEIWKNAGRHLNVKGTGCRLVSVATAGEDFHADKSTTFESIGLSSTVADAFHRCGFDRPSKVQACAIPTIKEWHDVVLGAETGSGKTAAYLGPIVMEVLDTRNEHSSMYKGWDVKDDKAFENTREMGLVLCPNSTLVEQVQNFANSLVDDSDKNLIKCAPLPHGMAPHGPKLDLVVGSPAGLLSCLDNCTASYGQNWLSKVRHIVIDEADMLMTGGYENKTYRIIELLRNNERSMAYEYLSKVLGVTVDEFSTIPRHIRKAGVRGGLHEMIKEGYKPQEESAQAAVQSFKNTDQSGLGRPPWHRQYIFVAATVPQEGKKTVGNEIRKLFPDAKWIRAGNLHRPIEKVHHVWVKLKEESIPEKVLEHIEADQPFSSGKGRILVFCNDRSYAERMYDWLENSEIDCVLFHAKMPRMKQEAAIQAFRAREGMVMVCTDIASRGLDIPDVHHVIQAQFAPSAVDFLHRIGRTGRAGRTGKVTSMYHRKDVSLVEALMPAIEKGEVIQGAFSRNRSFSKKYKKYGKFVPRGERPVDVSTSETPRHDEYRVPSKKGEPEKWRGNEDGSVDGSSDRLAQEHVG